MINLDSSLLSPHPQGQIAEIILSAKKFQELLPGESFKALVLDIRPGQVTIKLADGGTFTARSMVLPEARIGEEAVFTVKENDAKGHISLEMGKLTVEARQDNMLREALAHAGMSVNEETIELGRVMLQNNIPVDAASLQKGAFLRFTPTGGEFTPLEGVIFLLKENFPTEQSAVNAFVRTASPENSELLLKNISRVIDEIFKAPPEQTEALLKAVFPSERKFSNEFLPIIKEQVLKKFLLPLRAEKNEPQPSLPEYFKEVNGIFERLSETVTAKNISGALPEAVAHVKEALQTMQRINTSREYYQIPFTIGADVSPRQADLHIFKDKSAVKNPADKTYSALIALDTAGLKHTEVYIQKTGGQAFLTFRCDTDRALNILNAASNKLTQALKEKNIRVGSLAFNKIDEPFKLTDAEPYAEPPKQEEVKRFSFDMRV